MKLLLIAEGYYPTIGGGVRYMVDVVNHFRKKGHTVDVLTMNAYRRLSIEREAGGTIIRLPRLLHVSSASIAPAFPIWLFKALTHYDILHFNAPSPISELSYAVARTLSYSQPGSLTMIHGEVAPLSFPRRMYNRWLLQEHLRTVDRIVVSSQNYLTSSPMLHQFEEKVAVVPFGIDLSFFESPNEVLKTDLVEGKVQALKLLFVGRIVPIKGLDYLISAMVRAPGQLTIIGSGPQENLLKAQVANLGLQNRIRFLGEVRDDRVLREHYIEADVIVLPSTKEAFGYVLLEAMACKTAVISTELSTGTSFVNLHNRTGFVVWPRNSDAIAEAICLLDDDRGLLYQFQMAARQRVEQTFDVCMMLERTDALYREVTGLAR